MKPYRHARNSVKIFGGQESDYIEIHNFMDESKSHIADMRHRALMHHSFGCFIVEKVFGHIEQKTDGSFIRMPYIINSDGKKVQVRDIAEQHIREDLGWIPSVQDYFQHLKLAGWFSFPKFFVKKLIQEEQINV